MRLTLKNVGDAGSRRQCWKVEDGVSISRHTGDSLYLDKKHNERNRRPETEKKM